MPKEPSIRSAPEENVELSGLSTLGMGGRCRALIRIEDADEIPQAIRFAERRRLPVVFLGAGSNMLFSDEGFEGVLLQCAIRSRDLSGEELEVGAGRDLGDTIRFLNERGLSGLERMYGIPGTLGGAVVGNAGAYGQEIGDAVVEAEVWEGGSCRRVSDEELRFAYRHSIFKEQPRMLLLRCRLRLKRTRADLQSQSDEILSRRLAKYPPGLKCPGSFFKNVPIDRLPSSVIERIPDRFVRFGKIPAGYLLESVGAKDCSCGDAWIADYHANLFVNRGKAKSRDMLAMAERFSDQVRRRYGLRLEPEVRVVGPSGPANLSF